MFDPDPHMHVTWAEQAPHTFGEQPEQAVDAYREGLIASEGVEYNRLSDTERAPQAERDLVTVTATRSPSTEDDIDPEMTIAWGEDPGWSSADEAGQDTRQAQPPG